MIPPSVSRILELAQADAAQLEQVLVLILRRRPDLQDAALREHLLQLATTTPHTVLTWAESCLERARHGEPMPWEVPLKPARDPLAAWPVIDGPRQGERIASKRAAFDVFAGPPARGAQPERVRYYLRALVEGGYVWTCAAPA